MFWNRWHLAWLGVCFVAATAGAFFFLFMLLVNGLPRPSFTPIDLALFLLTVYTLPLVLLYVGGLVVGLGIRRMYRAFVRPRPRRTAWWSRPLADVKR